MHGRKELPAAQAEVKSHVTEGSYTWMQGL